MSFILWSLLIEDIFLLFAIGALFFAKQRPYVVVAVVTFVILLIINMLIFQGNQTPLLLMVPIFAFAVLNLLVRPFLSSSHNTLNPHATRRFMLILTLLSGIVVILGAFLLLKVFNI